MFDDFKLKKPFGILGLYEAFQRFRAEALKYFYIGLI